MFRRLNSAASSLTGFHSSRALSFGTGLWLVTMTLMAQQEPAPWEKTLEVRGRQLSIVCRGEGAPTVILENGYGWSTTIWNGIDLRIAEVTRVCAYEQPGLQRSPEGPQPRTAGEVADDLDYLLTQTQVKAPYLVVGHSFGGLVARLFAARHLDRMAGLVLLDSPHEDIYEEFARVMKEIGKDPTEAQGTPQIETSLDQIRTEAESLDDLPLVVMGHGRNRPRQGYTADQDAKMEAVWSLLQQRLATISRQGRYVEAEKSGHVIFQDQPDLVVEEITRLVRQSRQ